MMIGQRLFLALHVVLWATESLAFQPAQRRAAGSSSSSWQDYRQCRQRHQQHVAVFSDRKTTTTATTTALRSSPGDAAGDLTSALANLDQVWEIQQRSKPRSRWTKLELKNDDDSKDEKKDTESDPTTATATATAATKKEFVYLLEPPGFSNPSCLIVFIGGAALGTFPQVAYQEFLTRISDQMNAAVITAPYNVGTLDHFALAKLVGERSRKAILQCEEDPQRLYNANLPVYCLAHSLGCKLACIYAAATGQDYDGTGFVSFNNFSFGSTIGMAKEFAQSIRKETMSSTNGSGGGNNGDTTLDSIFDVAQSFLGNIGLEFTPSPTDTERLISLKLDGARIAKTRLFVMDEDNLDDSTSFLRACEGMTNPTLSALTGNHLTPVYFKLDLKDLPEDARELASESLGGFQSAAFGNDAELDALVNEVCGFLLGKKPTRELLLLSGSAAAATTTADEGGDEGQ